MFRDNLRLVWRNISEQGHLEIICSHHLLYYEVGLVSLLF